MRLRSRWPAAGALLLGGTVIVVGCAKGGPGETASAFGTDNVGFGAVDDGGGTTEASVASDSSVGAGSPGLNTPPEMSGDDASGGSGNAAPATCDPNTCQGCCANGTCAGGNDDTACGQAAAACTDCTATNSVCSFGSCVAGNESSSSGGSTDPGTGASPSPGSGMTPPRNPAPSTSCGGSTCTNACFPLGLPCCTSAGACGCIALYFLPCQ